MSEFVKASVARLNTETYGATPRTMQVPCDGSVPVAVEYLLPIVDNGRVTGSFGTTQDANEATPDSIKTIRVRNNNSGDVYNIVIPSSSDISAWATACNTCCGSVPDLTTGITITPVINEQRANESTATSGLLFAMPNNPYARNYTVPAISYNNGSVPFAPTAGGYASVSALLAALNSNASVMGTWSAINSNKTLRLVPANNVTSAGVDVDLAAGVFCLDIPVSAATVAVLTMKNDANVDTNITIPSLTLSEANRTGVLAAMRSAYPIGTWDVKTIGGTDYRLQYNGPARPVALKSADLTTSVVFSTGAC